MEKINWHNLSWEQIIKKLNSNSEEGLFEKEIGARQKKFGENKLPEERSLSTLKIFFNQFQSPLIYILVIAGIVTLILQEHADSIVIFGAVFLNTIIGFFQENKASKALRELKKVVKQEAQVIREGNIKRIDSTHLVPGDIFILNSGDKVPADGRLIEAHNLKINEMALTGEWLPAKKNKDILPEEISMADRDNMVYMGTIVEDGKAKVIVTGVGLQTEIGKVAEMLKEAKEEKTPLQKKLDRFAKIIGGIIIGFSVIIFIEGMVTGGEFIEMFTTAVAVAVAAIPEGLPVAMAVILAIGMQGILEKKGLVRKLVAAETLGSTSIIASDKTATLTEGKMRVSEILTGSELLNNKSGNHLLSLEIATLCNEAFIENPEEVMEKWIIRGDPTSRALLLAGTGAGINQKELRKKMPKVDEISFDPIHKYIANLYKPNEKEFLLYICGAPEKILDFSTDLEIDGKQKKLNLDSRQKIAEKLEDLTKKGLRVIAVAYKTLRATNKNELRIQDEINDLVFVGLIGLKDPLRKEVKEAIKICKQAGMRPIIVTGDHKLTAKAIAQEIGLKTEEENILEGKELDQMSDEEFSKKVKKIEVYARVEPHHKMRIIDAWQKKGEVVAMTGDGINDAPALKKADIGVAVGSGTDVAKEVADLILLSDSFNIIVAAVEEGRAIIDNIRKVITYLLSGSFTEIVLIGGGLFLGWPLPIVAVQILWVNLIEDGPLSLALAFEPKEKDLMKQKPQGHDVPLLTKEMKALIFIIGLVNIFLLLGLFFWLINYSGYEISHIRSIVFAALTIDSLFYVFSCKSLRRNLWHINPFSNKFLILTWILGVITLIAALYLPVLQTLLKTVPLNLFDWKLILGLGFVNIILIEAVKWYFIAKRKIV